MNCGQQKSMSFDRKGSDRICGGAAMPCTVTWLTCNGTPGNLSQRPLIHQRINLKEVM